jgi:hypothetical protein
MKRGVRRGLADMVCRALLALLPTSLKSWGWAIRYETAGIPEDTKALLFALGSLSGLMREAFAMRLVHPLGEGLMCRPRAGGVACGVGAVLLGLAYMALVGAPTRYMGVNAGALVLALAMLGLLGKAGPVCWAGVIPAMAAALMATALWGDSADGAVRWVKLAGLSIQPSLILLPAMLVAFARTRTAFATTGILIAVVAMALQPDRAMAGMMVASLASLAIARPTRHVIAVLGAGILGFAITLTRADTVPAAPYIDQILQASLEGHALAAAAVLSGLGLLLVPAVAGWLRDPVNRCSYAAFGTAWLAAIVAAAVGNHPTPLVGYGGSAIIGYVLSLLALPVPTPEPVGRRFSPSLTAAARPAARHLRVGLV